MTDGRISRPILQAVKDSANDSLVQELVTELLYEEAEHKGQWWWKETYRKKVKELANRRSAENENQ